MNLIYLIIFSALAFSDCMKVWEKENSLNPVISRCAVGNLELVELKNGCGLEGGSRERCAILRSCDQRKEVGASVFRSSVAWSSYCLSGKEMEVMNSSASVGTKAYITCRKKSDPKSIRIESDNKTKECAFPFRDTK